VESEDVRPESISITHCRELLGDEGEGLSDQDIDAIRQHAETMAHVIVDMFLERAAIERPESRLAQGLARINEWV
jgi:hypothetical protein